jgi:hypothetical protein
MRLVAVLGYSTWRGHGLHEVCTARLEAGQSAADGADAVLLSGWSRRRHHPSEAELMREAWAGPDVPLLVDGDARTTVGNVRAIARAVEELGADEVVLVTSSWHARRARLLAQATLGPEVRISVATPPPTRAGGLVAREAVCLPAAYATVSARSAFAVWRRFSASSKTALREP